MTPEEEAILRLLVQHKKERTTTTICELTQEAKTESFKHTQDILSILRDEEYISYPRIGDYTLPFEYDVKQKAHRYFYELDKEAQAKEELRNQTKQQHRHDVFILLIGGIISLILDNIENIFLFLKSLFTT